LGGWGGGPPGWGGPPRGGGGGGGGGGRPAAGRPHRHPADRRPRGTVGVSRRRAASASAAAAAARRAAAARQCARAGGVGRTRGSVCPPLPLPSRVDGGGCTRAAGRPERRRERTATARGQAVGTVGRRAGQPAAPTRSWCVGDSCVLWHCPPDVLFLLSWWTPQRRRSGVGRQVGRADGSRTCSGRARPDARTRR